MNQAIDSIKLSLKTLQGICFALLVFVFSPQPHIKYDKAIEELKALKDSGRNYYNDVWAFADSTNGYSNYREELKSILEKNNFNIHPQYDISSTKFSNIISPTNFYTQVSDYLEFVAKNEKIVVEVVDKIAFKQGIQKAIKKIGADELGAVTIHSISYDFKDQLLITRYSDYHSQILQNGKFNNRIKIDSKLVPFTNTDTLFTVQEFLKQRSPYLNDSNISLDYLRQLRDKLDRYTLNEAITKLSDERPSEKITVLGISFSSKPIFIFAPALTLIFLSFLMASTLFLARKQKTDNSVNSQIEGLFIFHENAYGRFLSFCSIVALPVICNIGIIIKLWSSQSWVYIIFSILIWVGICILSFHLWRTIQNISSNISPPSPLSNSPTHDKTQMDANTPIPPNS